jgi:DNA invertase Pin-like site-specific DNA recombinase
VSPSARSIPLTPPGTGCYAHGVLAFADASFQAEKVKFSDPGFRNSFPDPGFRLKPLSQPSLGQSSQSRLFPVVPHCGVVEPGQIRSPNAAFRGLDFCPAERIRRGRCRCRPASGRGPRKRSDINAERRARYEATNREIDRLVAEAHARLPRHLAKVVGAIYVRFSTWMQDSAEDQVRTILNFAVENGIFVPREHVYFDLAVRGHKSKRDGLDQLRSTLRSKMVKALLLFATNRLFRKVYRTLEFAQEVVSEHGIRAVFVKSGVDSANTDQWQMLLHFRAIMDEFQVKVGAEHIRAALEGLFLGCYVFGTLTFGYAGEPVPGKLTKRGRPRCRIVVHPDEAQIVAWIFEWFVLGLSLIAIAQKPNAIPNVHLPRRSHRWSRGTVRAVLMREAYRGLWKFSVTEKTFLPSKDYARQVPREKPLKEATFVNLRIVSDELWFAAQARLDSGLGQFQRLKHLGIAARGECAPAAALGNREPASLANVENRLHHEHRPKILLRHSRGA